MKTSNVIAAAIIIGIAIIVGAGIISYSIPRYLPVTNVTAILDTKSGQMLTCDVAGTWKDSDTGTSRDFRIRCGPEREKE